MGDLCCHTWRGGGLSLMMSWGQDSTLWVDHGFTNVFDVDGFLYSSLLSWAHLHPLYLGAGCSTWLWHHPNQLHGFAHGSGQWSHFCDLPSSLPACVRQVWLLRSTWLHQCRCGGRSCSPSFNFDTLYSIAASWTCTILNAYGNIAMKANSLPLDWYGFN